MLREFEDPVFEFAKRVSRLSNIRSVLLFGSVARGEADRRSDVDLLVIFDTQRNVNKVKETSQVSEIALNIEKQYNRSIQLLFSNRDFQGFDRQFVEEILKNGVNLFGRTPIVKAGKLRLLPYSLIYYTLSNLSRPEKMKVRRALYGHETKKSYKGKVYASKVTGLVGELEGMRTGIASILLPHDKVKVLTDTLDSFRVKYDRIDVWLSES